MSPEEQLESYDEVAQALDKRPQESLVDAAKRVLAAKRGHKAWPVAQAILSAHGDHWERILRAAKVARRLP